MVSGYNTDVNACRRAEGFVRVRGKVLGRCRVDLYKGVRSAKTSEDNTEETKLAGGTLKNLEIVEHPRQAP